MFPMKCSCAIAMLAALLVISSSALASKPETFWDWNAIRQDMELFEGAISHTVGYERMGAYVPGYGVVFMVESGKDLDAVQREVERVLTYVAPSISALPEGEKIAIVVFREIGSLIWSRQSYTWDELIYISDASTSSDPKTWEVYMRGPGGVTALLPDTLMSYFPHEEGSSWEYVGTDGYFHRMTLDAIYEDPSTNEVICTITGEIELLDEEELADDWSREWKEDDDDWGWGSWWDEDNTIAATTSSTLKLKYEFSRGSVVENILDGERALPHRFTSLQVLKTPIKKGAKWTYQTPDWTEVEAEIIEVGKDDEKLDYVKVRYTAELYEGTYTETRVYKKGVGLAEFGSINPDGSEFSYSMVSW